MGSPSVKKTEATAGKLTALLRDRWKSQLGRTAMWMLHGQGIQLAAQFGYYVMVARVLGPAGYGTFIGCAAAVNALAPFAPWGAGQILTKYASRDRSVLPVYFGNAILITIVLGLLWTAILLVLRGMILPPSVTPRMLTEVAIADLICTQLTAVCNLAFRALDKARQAANVLIVASVLRVIAALVLITSFASPAHWAQLYLLAASIACSYQIVSVCRHSGRPRVDLSLIGPSIKEGFHFATSLTAQTIYDNIDKTMVADLASVEAAAIYAVAYRFIDASTLPIRALASATYVEFFRKGEQGIASTYAFARKILKSSVLYGLLTSAALFVLAPLIPALMGHQYQESVMALRWLSPLPLIKSVHSFLTDVLTGADLQSERSVVQIAVAVFNVLINLWIIRAYSWKGAAISSLVTDSLLMVLLYLVIRWFLRREAAPKTWPHRTSAEITVASES